MTVNLTYMCLSNNLNFNCLDLYMCVEILERERERES